MSNAILEYMEEIKEESRTLGMNEGRALGLNEGRTMGMNEGRIDTILRLARKLKMTVGEAMDFLGLSDPERESLQGSLHERLQQNGV